MKTKYKKKRISEMTPEEVEAKIKADVAAGRFRIAGQEKINLFPEIKDLFMELVLRHPEAMVTDMSSVYDFDQWVPGLRITAMDIFGVDIEPILEKGGVLYQIFEYINRKPKSDLTLEQIAAQYGIRRKSPPMV